VQAQGALLTGKTSSVWRAKKRRKLETKMGRVSVFLSDDLEKMLRFKTIERFGGRKGDLSKAIEEAVKTWVEI